MTEKVYEMDDDYRQAVIDLHELINKCDVELNIE
jgi:hypothetical protein